MVGDIFLERINIENIATTFNIVCVPIVLEGTIQAGVDYVKSQPKSVLAKQERPSEGVVGIPAYRINDAKGNRLIIKIKVADFVK